MKKYSCNKIRRRKLNHSTLLKWYSALKNCFETDNYSAAPRLYTCTLTVYPLLNDISVTEEREIKSINNSKCCWVADLAQFQIYFRVRKTKLSHRKLAINWQLSNFGQKQSRGLLIWKWWIEWCLISFFFLYLTLLEAWISL